MSSQFYVLIYVLFEIAAVGCTYFAITKTRTPQGAVGWVVFLFAAPYLAVPAFLIFGHSRYPGYIRTRREMHGEIAKLRELSAEHAPDRVEGPGPGTGRATAFEKMAGVPMAAGNGARLLIDGEETFRTIFGAIERAEKYILIQFYTIADDALGREMADRLIARARAGVRVHVLYDALGSHGIPRRYLDRLREAGIDIRDFHAIRQSQSRLQINFRNHRKIVVVDGRVAFTGGLNLSDEYLGRGPRFAHWRDTMVELEGPVVLQLQFVFVEDWLWCSGDKLELDWTPKLTQRNMNALILAPGPADRRETGSLYFANAIGAARKRIWIASPYFVPDTDILTALKLAALRGIEVRILVPENRDHWLSWLAAFAYYDEMVAAGVEIWRYSPGFLHQKLFLVDDDIVSIGSINLDNRSCRLNFEVTFLAFDTDFAAEVETMLEEDFHRAFRMTGRLADQRPVALRFAAPFARLFAPLL